MVVVCFMVHGNSVGKGGFVRTNRPKISGDVASVLFLVSEIINRLDLKPKLRHGTIILP